MKYLIIYSYWYEITGFMGLEVNPEADSLQYKLCENIYELEDFIKEIEMDNDVYYIDEIIEINNYENIRNKFIKENSKFSDKTKDV